jgi:hypothetical protein
VGCGEKLMQGTLSEALTHIANRYGFNTEELIAYAKEDTLGGHYPQAPPGHNHPAPKEIEPNKGIWAVEGQVLYALIRALKPGNVLEIGNRYGCSTAHIAEAIVRNGTGYLVTIDICKDPILREEHQGIARQVIADLFYFDYKQLAPIGFIFEDSNHRPDMVEYAWRQFWQHGAPGAMMVSHDSEHERVGPGVREGIQRVTTDYTSYQIHPALCGLAMHRKTNAT